MINAKQTLADIKQLLENNSKSLCDKVLHLRFVTGNGRRFGIDGHSHDGFIAFEMLPTGMVASRGSLDAYKWLKHEDAMLNPNGYQKALEDNNIDPTMMIYMGGGSSPRDIVRPTLRDAVCAVETSIHNNVFLSDSDQVLGKLVLQNMTSQALATMSFN